jgi:hypothetical protein
VVQGILDAQLTPNCHSEVSFMWACVGPKSSGPEFNDSVGKPHRPSLDSVLVNTNSYLSRLILRIF